MSPVLVIFVSVLCAYQAFAQSDNSCTTPNGENATCISIYSCKVIYDAVESNDSDITFIQSSFCGRDSEDKPLVCCGSVATFTGSAKEPELESRLGPGNNCVTPNGEEARCVLIYSCQKLYDAHSSTDAEVLSFLRASFCGRDESHRPLVCCGSSASYVTAVKNPAINLAENDLLPDRSICGLEADQDKILNGEDTGLSEFPWLVLLQYRNRAGVRTYGCGGTLINPRYVLTAAHCVTNLKTLALVAVRLGDWNTELEKDCIGLKTNTYCNDPVNIDVEEAIPHSEYSINRLTGVFNDMALVRLKTEVTYTDFIRPVCLPTPDERSNVGEYLQATGWGATETGARSSIKQKLGVPIVEVSKCKSLFKSKGITVGDSQICAGGEPGKDACKGDSGGPLLAVAKNNTNQFYIEGVVSYGIGCGTYLPGIYTRVSDYLDWIKGNVRA